MFEISLRHIKNCIFELESIEAAVKRALSGLNDIYANFDSLVDGKFDKQALQIVIEDVSNELKGVIGLKEALEHITEQYEKTERNISSLDILNLDKDDFRALNLKAISKTLEALGVYFQ